MTISADKHGEPPKPWLAGGRIVGAMAAAAQIHAQQLRKGTEVPYVSHLLATCAIALEYGANEDEAIAALLHDAIEDGRPTDVARAIVWSFGDEVGRIVEGCTDADTDPKPPWRPRKEAYLASLAHKDRAVLLVSASDKLHNARCIVRDLHDRRQNLWTSFNAPRGDILWYYRGLVTAYRESPQSNAQLVNELDRTVTEMESLTR